MAVEIRLPTILRQDAGGQATVQGQGSTLGEVLEDLVRQFPNLAGKVVTEDGGLHKFVNVYVNDDDVRFSQGLQTTVGEGASVSIIPAVAGGC